MSPWIGPGRMIATSITRLPEIQTLSLTDTPTIGTWSPHTAAAAVAFDASGATVKTALDAVIGDIDTVTKTSSTPPTWEITWALIAGSPSLLAPSNVDLRKGVAAATTTLVQRSSSTEVIGIARAYARASRLREIVFTKDARNPIAVDQPEAGDWYPFQQQGDLTGYVADFYLSYVDDTCALAAPFHIAWVYGFGTTVTGPPGGWPTPTHSYDLVIQDAENTTVFDSTTATSFYTRGWADRLLIIEWRTDDTVCRVVLHQAWPPGETPTELPDYYVPENTDLNHRTVERLPKRLTAVSVGEDTLVGAELLLTGGHNADLEVADATANGVVDTEITVTLEPGAGEGVYPCTAQETELEITTLNGVTPDTHGNLVMATESCYRLTRPVVRISDGPPPRATVTPHTLALHDDCQPCCDCEDFVRVYEAIAQQWNTWVDIASTASSIRSQLQTDVYGAWNTKAALYGDRALKVVGLPICPCAITLAAAFCNQNYNSDIAVSGYFQFKFEPVAIEPPPAETVTFTIEERCKRTYTFVRGGSSSNIYSPVTLTQSGDWFVAPLIADIAPGETARLNTTFIMPLIDCYLIGLNYSSIEVTVQFQAVIGGSATVWAVTASIPVPAVNELGECCDAP